MSLFNAERRGGAWYWLDRAKRIQGDALDYLNGLRVPPAWKQVRANTDAKSKLRAVGVDVAGRLQRIYNPEWRAKWHQQYFCQLAALGKAWPRIEAQAKQQLQTNHAALAVRLTQLCGIRPGSNQSLANGRHGSSNLEAKHLLGNKDSRVAHLQFPGKHNVENNCKVADRATVKALWNSKKGDRLMSTSTAQINEFLKQFGPFSAKMLRTWFANQQLLKALIAQKPAESAAKRKLQLSEAVRQAAGALSNTARVCKQNYLIPQLCELFVEKPKEFHRLFRNPQKGLVAYLEGLRECK